MADQAPTLYIVATPIGNLGDFSQRAVEVLGRVSLIAAEDTRHSQRLFNHFGIRGNCLPYHEHSEEKTTQSVLAVLAEGNDAALVSDAGTPLISDPGYRLIRDVQDAGYRVSPIPGASALVAAISAAGLATDSFLFAGFLPAKQAARRARLAELCSAAHTQVFYEAPHRISASLADMCEVYGPQREAAVARELTKQFETLRRDTLQNLAAWVAADPNQQRGELVVLVAGADKQPVDNSAFTTLEILLAELPLKQAVSLAVSITGLKKNELYSHALEWQKLNSN